MMTELITAFLLGLLISGGTGFLTSSSPPPDGEEFPSMDDTADTAADSFSGSDKSADNKSPP